MPTRRNSVKKPTPSTSKDLNKPASKPSLPKYDDDDDNDEEDVTPPLTINFAATSMDHGYHLPPPPSLQPGMPLIIA